MDSTEPLRCHHWSRAVLSGSYLGRLVELVEDVMGPPWDLIGSTLDQVEGCHSLADSDAECVLVDNPKQLDFTQHLQLQNAKVD